ncbi:DUF1700 domain-containing protein [Mariniblastus fucicola]|nr:DUF4190 domain-containing protein [Mariniblastus fucicola]
MSDTMIKENPFSSQPTTSAFTEESTYQAVCKSAVASAIFAVLGLSAFLAQMFMLLPILGIVFALLALKAIRAYPDELVGKGAAKFGLLLSAVCLIGSGAMHSFIYATEVPEGYRRISFAELKPSSRGTDAQGFPKRAAELDGEKVFIKGYVRPPSGKQYGLKSFIMVGDFGDCCFGGDPAITDVVAIKIQSDDTVNYGYGLRRIGGTFRLNPSTAASDEEEIPRVFYEIEADHVR